MNEFECDDYLDLLPKLSNREIQILAMACAGFNRTEIALELSISVRTVDTHLTHAKQKYEIDSVAQLKARFFFHFFRGIKKTMS
ncbi:response regulator transcription factor [Arsenophonus nasoniae]|uniref:response regulator transcription factor n=1 Tax=Arsenophonus nasoniae TaxID=638 RepID=UPI00387A5128